MRLPNGFGGIVKLKGKRRRPFVARITVKWEFDRDTLKCKQIQKALGYYATRQEALNALVEYNNNPINANMLDYTFGDCYDAIKNDLKRSANYKSAFKYLEPLKDRPIRTIKADDMQMCIDSCQTTQQIDIRTLCHKIYDYALRKEIVVNNPSLLITSQTKEPEIVRNIFTANEVRCIENGTEWWQICLCCLFYSGMRTKELRTLEYDDIDLENMVVNIRQAKNKTSVRIIPIHTHARASFSRYKAEGIGFYGKNHTALNRAIKKHFNVDHSAHDTRHTFATRMRECGCDDLVLQKLLGHAPQTITHKIYTHLSIDELRSNLELLTYY